MLRLSLDADALRRRLRRLAEFRLNELSNKSSTLQGTADAFSRQSKALQWEMKWQRIRVWLLVAVLVVWGLAFFFVPVSKLVFFLISVPVFGLLVLAERCAVRRWRSQSDSLHARQWLGGVGQTPRAVPSL